LLRMKIGNVNPAASAKHLNRDDVFVRPAGAMWE
jgi:hypothetical protein